MDKERTNLKRIKQLAPLMLLLFSLFFVFFTRVTSIQSFNPIPLQLHLIGEYCYDDGPWMPLDENTEFGDDAETLKLRGKFDVLIPEPFLINFKTDHINVNMKINDEMYFESSIEGVVPNFDMCGRGWTGVMMPGFSESDVVELELTAAHEVLYSDAFDDFADNLLCGEKLILQAHLLSRNLPYFFGSAIAVVIGLFIIGGAATTLNTKVQIWYQLLVMGMTSIISGIFVFFNAPDIKLWSDKMIFNTNTEIVSMMLATFGYQALFSMSISGRGKKIAEHVTALSGLLAAVFMTLDVTGTLCMHDCILYWRIIQGIICLIMLIIQVYEIRTNQEWNSDSLYFSVIFITLIIEFINAAAHWWTVASLSIVVVMTVMFVYLCAFLSSVHRNFHMAYEAKNLKKELELSRVTLAMSQIKHHFIFNVLNAISGLCKYDPKKADETVVRFARYLRSNIDIIEEDKNIPFVKELEHLLDYIMLEQIRFGDKIKFETDIETEDFMIPPLILQPLAENAVKHGIMKKDGSGKIKMTVRREEKNIIITMEDDGAGFDTAAEVREGAVGIKNIRFRLKVMINGELHMSSVPGEGTCAVIKLPVTEEIL